MVRYLLSAFAFASASTNIVLRVLGSASAASSGQSTSVEERSIFPWLDMILSGRHGDALVLLDPRWWVTYVLDEFAAEPAHATVETICILTILYLLVWRKPAPMQQETLTKKVTHTTRNRRQGVCDVCGTMSEAGDQFRVSSDPIYPVFSLSLGGG